MNRADLQALADIRSAEALLLLGANMPDGAYYLAGYAVECALKAVIAKRVKQYDFPDKELAQECYTHSLNKLLSLAGLDQQLSSDSTLKLNWSVAKDWTEKSRYERKSLPEAQAICDAVTEAANGVLPWVKLYW